jgi:hypothetical protein
LVRVRNAKFRAIQKVRRLKDRFDHRGDTRAESVAARYALLEREESISLAGDERSPIRFGHPSVDERLRAAVLTRRADCAGGTGREYRERGGLDCAIRDIGSNVTVPRHEIGRHRLLQGVVAEAVAEHFGRQIERR